MGILRVLKLAGLVLLFFAVQGCNLQLSNESTTSPAFSMQLNPDALTVAPGSSIQTTLTVTPRNGFVGVVDLQLSGGPTGISVDPASVTVSGSPVSQTLTIYATGSAPTGTYDLRLEGSSGNLTSYASFNLTIGTNAAPGTHWTIRESGTTKLLRSVAFGNGTFVAGGEGGTLLSSTDGVSWTVRPTASLDPIRSVIFAQNKFVALQGRYVLISTDGATWSSNEVEVTLYDVAYGGGRFVGVGSGGNVLTSSDAVNWTKQGSITSYTLLGIAYGNGVFTTVAGGGKIFTSSDGVNWTERQSGTSNALQDVAYAEDRFVAVGDAGRILTSAHGVTWTPQLSGTNHDLYGIGYGDGIFVAVGGSGCILTSPDAVSWTERTSGTGSTLRGVAYGNGSFVAVGSSGAVLTSP
ncbi:hypothetical protein [Oceanithermus sp.]|uniref:hypothetical protein n=1 Tax=Oceanithermus sp. TaxID=2268145 RepID=UPI002579F815|nr:hypothetical protein [Oceanithermus sp.]